MKIFNALKKAKVEPFRVTGKDLTEATRPPGEGSPGSFKGSSPEGESYTGIKITIKK